MALHSNMATERAGYRALAVAANSSYSLVVLASYPGPEGGGKRAWHLLHAHALDIMYENIDAIVQS